jgi:hypothetical protein
MVENSGDSTADVKFWSSYRFFIDPRYCSIEVLRDQPQKRSSITVPNAQWRSVVESFDGVGLELMLKESGEDEGWIIRQQIAEAGKLANLSLDDVLRRAAAGAIKFRDFGDKLDGAKRQQADAYKRLVLWRAKHRSYEATGEIDPWLREPDVQKGIQFACEANDEKFFESLGRILSDAPAATKRLPVLRLFWKNWIQDDLPLAIFSDSALAQLSACMSEQWEAKQEFTKDSITKRRIEYGLETLGSTAYCKTKFALRHAVGPVINKVKWSGEKMEIPKSGKPNQLHELIASSR